MNNWQTVFKTTALYQAEIVRAVLEEHDLNAVIINKKDSSYHWGLIEVKVNADHVIKAIKIIEEEIKLD